MSEYSIWAQIHHTAPQEFVVVVSAVPAATDQNPDVQLRVASNLQTAESTREALLVEVGQRLRHQGSRVVDVIEE